MNKGYISSVTEFGAGWTRPNGYVITTNRGVAFELWGKTFYGDYKEFSIVDGKLKICCITGKCVEEISGSEKGYVWISRDMLDEFVEEM